MPSATPGPNIRHLRPAEAQTRDILDAALVPTLLNRIETILASLQEVARNANSLTVNSSATAQGEGQKPAADASASIGSTLVGGEAAAGTSSGQNIATASSGVPTGAAETLASESLPVLDPSVGPSLALGAVSDDDHSLYDFLFSSASHGQSGSSGAKGSPTELSLRLLKESRELRDIYRESMRAVDKMPAGDWGFDEQQQMITELETMKEIEEKSALYELESDSSAGAAKRPADEQTSQEFGKAAKVPRPQTFAEEILVHLRLSSQVAHALFTSIQSAHSTALPPSPIPRPPALPGRLRNLPIWLDHSAPSPRSPTASTLIPSLLSIHDSLDETLLRARTHRVNARRIEALKNDVQLLRSQRIKRIESLHKASSELRSILVESKSELKKIERASRSPLVYKDVMDYAADLARVTSAPPGWSDGMKSDSALRDTVESVLNGGQGPTSNGHQEAQQLQQPEEAKGDDASQSGGPEANADSKQLNVGSAQEPEAASPKQAPAATSSSFLLHALRQQQQQQQGQAGDDAGAAVASSTSSAPHALPFPSDADMRRGLMGVAMMADMEEQQQRGDGDGGRPASSKTMKGLLPSWAEFVRAKRAEMEAAAHITAPDVAADDRETFAAATATGAAASRNGGERLRPVEDDGGFGLDL
ncbi:unnamed protein product [Parajaminaea phylloscopi]